MPLPVIRLLFVVFLAFWTLTAWGGNPAWLLIGASVSGIVLLCMPVDPREEE